MVETFNLPKTLKQLFLQNNNIQDFPSDTIANLTNLNLLDLRNNKLITFNDSLVEKIKQGVNVFFEGK
jgi:Leucine-rich repeat (LRR) protein